MRAPCSHHITLRSLPGVSNNQAITKQGMPWLPETRRLQEQLPRDPYYYVCLSDYLQASNTDNWNRVRRLASSGRLP